ncbi:MAG: helix-turn-helix domain-containing protein [Clostridia bacterium]|nr:helix-turn-helix domain-containing protein [Clostridia bacterium]
MEIEHQPFFVQSAKASELVIGTGGFVCTDSTWQQEPLFASYSRLYFVLDGSGMLYSADERVELTPGVVYLAPCGMKYGFFGTDSVTKLFFHINLTLTPGGYDAFSHCGRFFSLPYEREKMKRLVEQYRGEDPCGHFALKSELYRVVGEFVRQARASSAERVGYSKCVADAVRYIHRHLRADLTVKEIAEAVFCSQSKLSALFRQEVGQSVACYTEDLLMSEAQTLLIYSETPIGEISERLGFCDQFYFSRRFAKRFSVSPKEFRSHRSHGEKDAVLGTRFSWENF